MPDIYKDLIISPFSTILIIFASLIYLAAKKYAEKFAENVADRHSKWKAV